MRTLFSYVGLNNEYKQNVHFYLKHKKRINEKYKQFIVKYSCLSI